MRTWPVEVLYHFLRPYELDSLASSYVGTNNSHWGSAAGSYALRCGSGFGASADRFTLTLFHAMTELVIGCGYDGNGVVKKTKQAGSTSVLGGTIAIVLMVSLFLIEVIVLLFLLLLEEFRLVFFPWLLLLLQRE